MPKIITYAVAVVSVLLILLFFRDSVADMLMRTVIYSVKTYLPTQGVAFPKKKDTQPSELIPGVSGIPDVTARPGGASKNDAGEAGELIAEQGFSDTPEDILKLVEEAEKNSANDKKGGTISEKQYKNDGVTDSYGNVRVKNVNETDIDIEKILNEEIDLSVDRSQPAVLIFHTHTTETYQLLDRGFYEKNFATRTSDEARNMLRVGDAVAEEIEKAGFRVIHDREIHDSRYNGAYSRSRERVIEYLKKYPSIQVVLDVHRDAIALSDGTKIKPTCTVQGQKAAQIMIISGCQEEGGPVTGFPDWRENLTFAVQLQNRLETLFPGITRPLYFSPRKYNMDLTHCSLLVEVGADANTLGEAVLSGKCLGRAVTDILEEYEE